MSDEKTLEITITDSDGNIMYYGKQSANKPITVPLKKILEMKKRNEQLKLRKQRT